MTSKRPTIKKAAHRQSNTAKRDMIYNSNYIGNRSTHSIDIENVSRRASEASETQSGADFDDEFLLNEGAEVLCKAETLASATSHKSENFVRQTKTEQTPRVTRGQHRFKGLKTGVDYLTLCAGNVDYRRWSEFVFRHFKGTFKHLGKRGFYQDTYEHEELGISIHLKNLSNADRSKCEFKGGSALALLNLDEQVALIRDAVECGFEVSRVDYYVDVFDDDLQLVEEIAEHGSSGFNLRLKTKRIQEKTKDMLGGLTFEIGSRSSTRMWRCYDKGAEQGQTKNRWQRIEVQNGGCKATESTAILSQVEPDKYEKWIQSFIFVNCWEKEPDVWGALRTHEFNPIEKRPEKTLNRWIKYTETNFIPKIRMIAEEFGLTPEQVFTFINGLCTDDIVSRPARYQIFLRELGDLMVDSNYFQMQNTGTCSSGAVVGNESTQLTQTRFESVTHLQPNQQPPFNDMPLGSGTRSEEGVSNHRPSSEQVDIRSGIKNRPDGFETPLPCSKNEDLIS